MAAACGRPTEHADEEGLVDQFVALRVDQVELEEQAAALLPLLVAVLQQAWGRTRGIGVKSKRLRRRIRGKREDDRGDRGQHETRNTGKTKPAPLLTSSWVKL